MSFPSFRWSVIAVALAFVLGVTVGKIDWAGKFPASGRYAPARRQQDGSLELERIPKAPEDLTPKQHLPKGAKVERTVQVQVQTKSTFTPGDPVTVDLTVVRTPDNSTRVIASTPDGTVVGGIDTPVDTSRVVRIPCNAVGFVYGTTAWGDSAKGVFYDRDLARLRLGAEVTRNFYNHSAGTRQAWELRMRLGFRF